MRWKPGLAETAEAAGMPLLAFIYDRVSKDPSGRKRSTQQQMHANLEACRQHGFTVADTDAVFTDNDRSASMYATKNRPDWERLTRKVAEGRCHVVVLWEVSRGDRHDLRWITFLHTCRDLGVWIHITSDDHTYDLRRDRDYDTLADEGLKSASESARISKRILRDVQASALKGNPHGRLPYGYRREYEFDSHGVRHLTAQLPDDRPRPATAEDGTVTDYSPAGVVRQIFRRWLRGWGLEGIAAALNWRGIPAPRNQAGGWDHTSVRKVLDRPTYAGLRTLRGTVVATGIWPPLVSTTDYHKAVSRLRDPARRTSRDSSVKYLGSGIYVCGVCEAPVATIKRTYGGEPGRAYNCRPKVKRRRAGAPLRREVTEPELAELRALHGPGQVARAVDLADSMVTLSSIARGLGVGYNTLSWRVQAERRRRAGSSVEGVRPSPGTGEPKQYHVVRRVDEVDAYVQAAVWLRLARPDIAELLAEDEKADQRLAALEEQIAEKVRLLDEARDSHAAGPPDGLSLDGLLRVEKTLIPEIDRLRSEVTVSRLGPLLEGLAVPDVAEVEAEWWRRSIPQRREVVRALIERVEILRLPADRKSYTPEESVRITWRG